MPDLGKNMQSLGYSKIVSVKNNAKQTIQSTNDFIKNLDNQMKQTPLIDSQDKAYLHYLNYNNAKAEMKKSVKRMYFRRILFAICVLIIISMIIYFILFKTGGDGIKELDDEFLSEFSNQTLIINDQNITNNHSSLL